MPYTYKPYSEACEQNKAPILSVLQNVFTEAGFILEIGSGTGQHAVHFAQHLPHLIWQCSDVAAHLPGIRLWLDEVELPNLPTPLSLDVTQTPWPVERADGVYSANTAHIMSWPQVEVMFDGIGEILQPSGCFCLYGPFSYGGRHTSQSNARFDAQLKIGDPRRGVRDFDDLKRLAESAGLEFLKDHAMPVNNRTLVWRKA